MKKKHPILAGLAKLLGFKKKGKSESKDKGNSGSLPIVDPVVEAPLDFGALADEVFSAFERSSTPEEADSSPDVDQEAEAAQARQEEAEAQARQTEAEARAQQEAEINAWHEVSRMELEASFQEEMMRHSDDEAAQAAVLQEHQARLASLEEECQWQKEAEAQARQTPEAMAAVYGRGRRQEEAEAQARQTEAEARAQQEAEINAWHEGSRMELEASFQEEMMRHSDDEAAQAAVLQEHQARLASLEEEWRRLEPPRIARSVYASVYVPGGSGSSVYDQSAILDHYELDDPQKLANAWGGDPPDDIKKKLARWKEVSKSVCLVTYRMEAPSRSPFPCGVWEDGRLTLKPMFGQAETSAEGEKLVKFKPSLTSGLKPAPGDALGDKFAMQKFAGIGTGFLVAANQIVTAGHVIKNDNWIPGVAFVFDYKVGSDGKQPDKVQTDHVYYAKKVSRPTTNQQYLGDCVVVTLDRNVPKSVATPLELGWGDLKQRVGVWGHPCGLPLKSVLSGKCTLQKQFSSGSALAGYLSSIDTFGGNSGSPIFNIDKDMAVVGILIEGGTDFKAVGADQFTYATYSSTEPKEKILNQEHFRDLIA